MNYREALLLTIKKFNLEQTEISRRTEILERRGKGKMVRADQLNRYLRGKRDIFASTHETIIRSLDDEHRAFYLSLLENQWNYPLRLKPANLQRAQLN